MDYEIVGKLLAQGNAWELLELAPREIGFDRGVRNTLKSLCVEFLVLLNDEPRYILVAGGFVIIPTVDVEEGDDTESKLAEETQNALAREFADKFITTD